jgi:hypothetical protein
LYSPHTKSHSRLIVHSESNPRVSFWWEPWRPELCALDASVIRLTFVACPQILQSLGLLQDDIQGDGAQCTIDYRRWYQARGRASSSSSFTPFSSPDPTPGSVVSSSSVAIRSTPSRIRSMLSDPTESRMNWSHESP